MTRRCWRAPLPLALLVSLACAEPASDRRAFVPEGLPNTNPDGERSGLLLLAFTLRSDGLYAAVRNDAATPACSAGMLTDFFDGAGQLVASTGSVLQGRQFYRLESGEIIPCIDAGEVAMAASTELPASLHIEQLGRLSHTFPSFTIDGIVPVAGLTISELRPAGAAFAGTLHNGFAQSVSAPRVTVFPVNAVGRPLARVSSSAAFDLPPGAAWSFRTDAVEDPGVTAEAYPN